MFNSKRLGALESRMTELGSEARNQHHKIKRLENLVKNLEYKLKWPDLTPERQAALQKEGEASLKLALIAVEHRKESREGYRLCVNEGVCPTCLSGMEGSSPFESPALFTHACRVCGFTFHDEAAYQKWIEVNR